MCQTMDRIGVATRQEEKKKKNHGKQQQPFKYWLESYKYLGGKYGHF